MPEIERKFRLAAVPPRDLVLAVFPIAQGYLFTEGGELRVRRRGDQYFLTVKGDGSMSRDEWEAEIPVWVFGTIWPKTEGKRIEKVRYVLDDDGRTLEVDEYKGRLQGLVTMECEFPDEQTAFTWVPPSWAETAREVTQDKRFKNKALATEGLPKDE